MTNAWDGFGRLASSTTNMDGVSRTLSGQYDAAGNRTLLSGDQGYSAAFSYDGLGRMTAYVGLVQFGYDPAGRRSSLAMGPGGTGSSVGYAYDPVGRLQTLTHELAGTAGDQTLGFAYNPASQIISRSSTNDAYASNTAYNVSRSYSVNGLNQYTSAGPATFAYDANGNLTSDGSTGFVYDAENRLVSASGAKTATLAYDPLGRLWQVSGSGATTRFLYDGDRLVMELNGSSAVTRSYVHGPGTDEPLVLYDGALGWARRFLHADHQGSIVALNDDSGNVVAVNAYDTWGIPKAGNVGRFGYTGQVWIAELGLWYYKARFYSPTLGRFLQTDPVGYKDQMNLYVYVGNDPVNRTDPSGLYECVNKRACDQFEQTKKTLMRSIRILERSKSERDRSVAAITRVGLSQLGARGDINGTKIDASTSTELAFWDKDSDTLGINVDNFSKHTDLQQAGAIGHEMTHTVQDGAGMISPRTLLAVEALAYTNQAIIEHSLGKSRYWDDANNDVDRALIRAQARRSCSSDVGSQDKWYLCR